MTLAALAFTGWLGIAGTPQVGTAPLVRPPSDSSRLAWTAAWPDQARDSLRRLLAGASAPDPGRADAVLAQAQTLALAYLQVWGDSFPLREVRRFAAWPRSSRIRRATADSLRLAGNRALGAAGLAAALADWRASAAIARELGDTGSMAAAIGNIGTGFYYAGEPDSAESYFRAARRLAAAAGDRRTYLNATGGLASLAKDRGDLAAASSGYREAIALRRGIGDYRGVAADANNLGLVATALGDRTEARRRHTEALITARDHGLDEPAAAALLNLGTLEAERGRNAAARDRYLEARVIYRERGDAADEALALYNLGLLAASEGDYRSAIARYRAALPLLDRTGAPDEAFALRRDIALLHAAMGDLDQAMRELDRATEAAARDGVGAGSLGSLELLRGDLAMEFNQLVPATTAYSSALRSFRRAADPGGEAEALGRLGSVRLASEDYAGAARLLRDATERLRALGDARATGLALLAQAEAERRAGDVSSAGRSLGSARAMLGQSREPVLDAWALCQAGEQARAEGLPLAAEAQYRAGLASLGSRPAVGVSTCLTTGLGGALAERGAWRQAAVELGRGIERIEVAAGGIGPTIGRADYLSDKWSLYSDLALVQHATRDDSAAFATSERMRARQALENLDGPSPAAGQPDPGDPQLLALRRRITTLMRSVGTDPGYPTARGADGLDRFSNLEREALLRTQESYAAMLDSLASARPVRVTDRRTPGPVDWRTVASRLRPDDALIEYLVSDSTVLAFVITRDRLSTVALPVSGRTLAAELDFLRGVMAPAGAAARGDRWRTPLERLHAQLVAPLADAGLLAGRRRLIIVPHRELHYLPFAALLDRSTSPARYLVEQYDIGTAPSAAVWRQLAERPAPPPARTVLAVAPIPATLPGTAAEARAIAKLYGASATVLVGPEATRSAVTREARGRDIVHLATLGVLNRQNPGFSYVALAEGPDTDGRLEVHDVAAMTLSANLVVLSACQTGLGAGRAVDVPPGDDWVGLVGAFQAAGARNVLATLWPVDDRRTSGLMTEFYRELVAGTPEVRALAGAQRRALARPATSAPYYWAGFVLNGSL